MQKNLRFVILDFDNDDEIYHDSAVFCLDAADIELALEKFDNMVKQLETDLGEISS